MNYTSDDVPPLCFTDQERYPHRMSTLDLLHAFRGDPKLTGQIFVVADEPKGGNETMMTPEATS